jgi:flagellar hook-length control protein FliK
MEPAAAAPAPAADASLPPPPGSEAFAPALGAAITRFVRDGIEHARLQLNPAELGPVAVQLALDGSQVRVEMAAEVAATRDALQAALPALAGALREAGFTLGGGGVFQQPPQPSRDASGERLPGPAERRDAEAPIKAVAAQRQGLVDLYA